jgi:hypothetical protein
VDDMMNIECRTPRVGEWVRVRPEPDYRKEVVLIRDEGEYCLVVPHMVPKLEKLAPGRIERSMLFLACNQEGVGFLWPVKLPVPEEHLAYRAMQEWVCFPLLQ